MSTTVPGGTIPRIEPLLLGNGINFAQGDLALSGVFLIRAVDPEGRPLRIVVDTGHVGMRRNVLEAVVKAGLTTADIDLVVLTHVHWDHVQNVDLFPNATLVLAASELESISHDGARDIVTPSWTRHLLEQAPVRTVEPGEQLAAGVRIVDAAGHTPGSIAIAVESGDEVGVITGDALPWAEVGRLQQSALVFWNLEKSQDAIRRLVELADIIYPGHDRPFRLIDGVVEYQAPFEATLFGAAPDTPGLTFAPPVTHRTIDMTDGVPVGPRWTKEELEP